MSPLLDVEKRLADLDGRIRDVTSKVDGVTLALFGVLGEAPMAPDRGDRAAGAIPCAMQDMACLSDALRTLERNVDQLHGLLLGGPCEVGPVGVSIGKVTDGAGRAAFWPTSGSGQR